MKELDIIQYKVRIVGLSDLLMDRFSPELLSESETKRRKLPPEEQARMAAHRDAEGFLVIPSEMIKNCLAKGLGPVKDPYASKRNIGYRFRSAVRIDPKLIRIQPERKDYEIDARSVWNKKVGRVMKYRPCVKLPWSAEFILHYWAELYYIHEDKRNLELHLKCFNQAGLLYGLGSFRPERGGEFGTFKVESMERVT